MDEPYFPTLPPPERHGPAARQTWDSEARMAPDGALWLIPDSEAYQKLMPAPAGEADAPGPAVVAADAPHLISNNYISLDLQGAL